MISYELKHRIRYINIVLPTPKHRDNTTEPIWRHNKIMLEPDQGFFPSDNYRKGDRQLPVIMRLVNRRVVAAGHATGNQQSPLSQTRPGTIVHPARHQ